MMQEMEFLQKWKFPRQKLAKYELINMSFNLPRCMYNILIVVVVHFIVSSLPSFPAILYNMYIACDTFLPVISLRVFLLAHIYIYIYIYIYICLLSLIGLC